MPAKIVTDFSGTAPEPCKRVVYVPERDPTRPDPPRPSGRRDDETARPRLPRFIVGLDLGQAQDPTALVITERRAASGGALAWRPPVQHTVRQITRAPLGMPYPKVVQRVATLIKAPPLAGAAHLVIDATGVGRPVVDLLRAAGLDPLAVTITAGTVSRVGWRAARVTKRDLVTAALVALQQGRLAIPAGLPGAADLVCELQDFRMKISAAGHDTYAAAEGQHDDLVIALALCVWRGDRLALPVEPVKPALEPEALEQPRRRSRPGNVELMRQIEDQFDEWNSRLLKSS